MRLKDGLVGREEGGRGREVGRERERERERERDRQTVRETKCQWWGAQKVK